MVGGELFHQKSKHSPYGHTTSFLLLDTNVEDQIPRRRVPFHTTPVAPAHDVLALGRAASGVGSKDRDLVASMRHSEDVSLIAGAHHSLVCIQMMQSPVRIGRQMRHHPQHTVRRPSK